ncbi:MAG: alpha/beta hydrolase, partial [Oscillospiraceae bacterium]|nr:alpha/beta hydrolase [Oscillospiraceae bacterium]
MKLLKNLLFALLCLMAFGVAALISFFVSVNHLVQTNLGPIQVTWDGSVGYILSDLSYGSGEKNTYDLYIPAEMPQGQPCSLVLLIHGGGFTGGDKADDSAWCKYFASKGLLCASINYTLASEENNAALPLMFQETAQAVEAIYEKAEAMGFPITEMAATGSSAGGTLALMYAYHQPEDAPIPIKFVFEQTGPASFEPELWGNTTDEGKAAFITVMSGQSVTAEMVARGEAQRYIDAISPAAQVGPGTVPTLMAYGPKDKIVPPQLK